jgi:hypothetical protein
MPERGSSPCRLPKRKNRYADTSSVDAARRHGLAGERVDPACFGDNIWKLLLGRQQSDLPRLLQGRILRQGISGLLHCRLQGEMLRADGDDIAIPVAPAPLRRLVVFVMVDLPDRRARH